MGSYCGNCGRDDIEWVTDWARDENGIARPVGGEYRCKNCGSTDLRYGQCHITKVVCYGIGLPDDCHQLNEIRRFRDEYLDKQGFDSEVKDYYANSKHYAKKIEEKAKTEPELYERLYKTHIKPAVSEIEKNNMKTAHRILKAYLRLIKEEF